MRRALTLLVLLLAAAGCNSSTKSGPAASKKYRVAVVPKGTTHVFWKSVHAGALKAAKELGNVEIDWNGPMNEGDREGQITLVQNFIAGEVDGLVLAPLDRTALVPFVRDAKQSDIPTVIFDSALDPKADELIVSYVATDNYNGGVLAARELSRRLNGRGNVILLRYAAGSESTEQREQGFLDTLKKESPDIKILSDNQYSGTTLGSAFDVSLRLLNSFGDKVNGIFTVGEPLTIGMLKALKQEGLAGKVIFIGFDSSPEAIDGMRAGHVHGVVLQDPVNMGYTSVKTIVAHLEGKPVSKRIPTGEAIATPENMDEPKMKRLLSPEQAD